MNEEIPTTQATETPTPVANATGAGIPPASAPQQPDESIRAYYKRVFKDISRVSRFGMYVYGDALSTQEIASQFPIKMDPPRRLAPFKQANYWRANTTYGRQPGSTKQEYILNKSLDLVQKWCDEKNARNQKLYDDTVAVFLQVVKEKGCRLYSKKDSKDPYLDIFYPDAPEATHEPAQPEEQAHE